MKTPEYIPAHIHSFNQKKPKLILPITVLLAILPIMLTGCSPVSERWPRLSIQPTNYRADNIDLPLREGYVFAEQPFEIRETEKGYDIIIHAIPTP